MSWLAVLGLTLCLAIMGLAVALPLAPQSLPQIYTKVHLSPWRKTGS